MIMTMIMTIDYDYDYNDVCPKLRYTYSTSKIVMS